MSSIPRFAAYAAAFEKAYESNDWSLVEPFFTEDAVYEVHDFPEPLGGVVRGRGEILAYFDRILNGFDRKFGSRAVELLEGPRESDGAVWLKGRAIYTTPGLPNLVFDLEETATFAGDRIRLLEDRYEATEIAKVLEWARAYGDKIGITVGELGAT
jgi:hypothetical protein